MNRAHSPADVFQVPVRAGVTVVDDDGLTGRLHDKITAHLAALPELPAKMGIALDTGPHSLLSQVSNEGSPLFALAS